MPKAQKKKFKLEYSLTSDNKYKCDYCGLKTDTRKEIIKHIAALKRKDKAHGMNFKG